MRHLARWCLLSVAAGAAHAQAPTSQATKPTPGYVDPRGRFAVDPPRGWRTLTPDEGRSLRSRGGGGVPVELLDPQPPHVVTLGSVDRWLAGEFDGKALSVAVVDGEPDLDEAGLAALRNHFDSLSARGAERYAIEKLTLSSVSAGKCSALLANLVITDAGKTRLRFDAYVPTAGETVTLALTWPVAQREGAEAAFGDLCASVQIGAPARGPSRLGSKLLWAALLGLCIGTVLHTLRKRMTG